MDEHRDALINPSVIVEVLVIYFDLDTSLRLDSINCALQLADVYDRIATSALN